MKRIYLVNQNQIAAEAILMMRVDQFTLGYPARTPWGDPSTDDRVEARGCDNERLYFVENGCVLPGPEFAEKLIRLVNPEAKALA